jgi:hypothetical protein
VARATTGDEVAVVKRGRSIDARRDVWQRGVGPPDLIRRGERVSSGDLGGVPIA